VRARFAVNILGLTSGLAVALAAAPPAQARGADRWKAGPQPAWVLPAPAQDAPRRRAEGGPAEYLLDDTQVRVSGATVETYHHVITRPQSPSEVEDISELDLEVDPAFEKLVIHHVRIVRGRRTFSAFVPREVKVVQREKDFEQRIYDGTLSALVFLHDVRVGDVVDYAYSIVGSNPLLGGKHVERFEVAGDAFIARWRHRILVPEARTLAVRPHGTDVVPKVGVSDGWREYLWERHDVAPVEAEDDLPGWFDPVPQVEVSEFASWGEVAALYQGLYTRRRPLSRALAREVERLRAGAAGDGAAADEARLLAAIRFVQDDVRYLGIELGPSSHAPFDPSVVHARRFGDCKDKAVLLATLLGELGFPARPALVDSRAGRTLDEQLPSPFAFDHAIVQVSVGQKEAFVDPTISYQRGRWASRRSPDYERALVLAPGASGLTPIPRPRPSEPSQSVRETFVVGADGAADLEVETTYRRDAADDMRRQLGGTSRKELGKEYLNYYARQFPEVTVLAELAVSDDEAENTVVAREHYRLGDFWEEGRRDVLATGVLDHLDSPRTRVRTMPFGLEYPLRVSHVTTVRLPSAASVEPETQDLGDDHARFRFASRARGNEIVLEYELETLADAVPAAKAARFFHLTEKMRDTADYVLERPRPRTGAGLPKHTRILLGLGVLALAAARLWRRARRRSHAL
jgi:transglutaminase-like putative cysteine protease